MHYTRLLRHGDPLAVKVIHGDDSARFWEKVNKLGPDECWEWTGAMRSNGYGSFWSGSKKVGPHAYSLEMSGQPRPGDLFACHHCDNPSCVNPSHLYWATTQKNTQDAVDRGLTLRGERHVLAKLSDADAVAIRHEYASGADVQWIADTYGISKSSVYNLALGNSWQWADGPITRRGNKKKTQCKHGHAFTPENTSMQKRKGRPDTQSCKACHRINQAKYLERKAAA